MKNHVCLQISFDVYPHVFRRLVTVGDKKLQTHDELYIILKGEGQYQVDGEIFPVSEGTIIRVAPDGKRALKNSGSENLTMLCIQYKANAFTEADSPMTDGVILQDALKW